MAQWSGVLFCWLGLKRRVKLEGSHVPPRNQANSCPTQDLEGLCSNLPLNLNSVALDQKTTQDICPTKLA